MQLSADRCAAVCGTIAGASVLRQASARLLQTRRHAVLRG